MAVERDDQDDAGLAERDLFEALSAEAERRARASRRRVHDTIRAFLWYWVLALLFAILAEVLVHEPIAVGLFSIIASTVIVGTGSAAALLWHDTRHRR